MDKLKLVSIFVLTLAFLLRGVVSQVFPFNNGQSNGNSNTQFNATRVSIQYGPFSLPASTHESMGTSSFVVNGATLPCTDCLVTRMAAGLQYQNSGSYAGANTSMRIEHVIIENLGRKQLSCPTLPETFFGSGDDRSPIDLTNNGTVQAGYVIKTGDTLNMTARLINDNPVGTHVVLTMDWDYISAVNASGTFEAVSVVYLDVSGNCENSSVVVPASDSAFSLAAPSVWTADASGSIIAAGGHVQEGRIQLEIQQNDKAVCTVTPKYGATVYETTGYDELVGLTNASDIISVTNCYGLGTAQASDKWNLTASYNYNLHPLMVAPDGGRKEAMGVALVYIATSKFPLSNSSTGSVGPVEPPRF